MDQLAPTLPLIPFGQPKLHVLGQSIGQFGINAQLAKRFKGLAALPIESHFYNLAGQFVKFFVKLDAHPVFVHRFGFLRYCLSEKPYTKRTGIVPAHITRINIG